MHDRPQTGTSAQSDPSSVSALQAELDETRAELVTAREMAELYRLSAKARAEEITELLRRVEAAPEIGQTRELRRLRELEKRWTVRVIVRTLEPLERPYQALKRRTNRGGRARG